MRTRSRAKALPDAKRAKPDSAPTPPPRSGAVKAKAPEATTGEPPKSKPPRLAAAPATARAPPRATSRTKAQTRKSPASARRSSPKPKAETPPPQPDESLARVALVDEPTTWQEYLRADLRRCGFDVDDVWFSEDAVAFIAK